jgi:hypothetical protein
MATEAVDARHEAILCLHRAILAIEQDDVHTAEMHTLAAVAWERDLRHDPSLGLVKRSV